MTGRADSSIRFVGIPATGRGDGGGERQMRVSAESIFDLLDAKATGPGARFARLAHQVGIGLGVATLVLATDASLQATFGTIIDLMQQLFQSLR